MVLPPEEEARSELRLRRIVPPAVLLVAWLIMRSGSGFFRTFFTMWVHELGHAVAAWMCGYGAIPGPWRTIVSEGRSLGVSLLLLGALAFLGWRAHRAGVQWVVILAGCLGAAHALLLFIPVARAEALIAFSGDAGLFVLGALGVTTFFAPPGSHLHRTHLRWGFLVIGAFAWADGLHTWWAARRDPEAIPFGEIEGVGGSDPTRLMDDYGWTVGQMVSRYLLLAASTGLALAGIYAWNAWVARSRD